MKLFNRVRGNVTSFASILYLPTYSRQGKELPIVPLHISRVIPIENLTADLCLSCIQRLTQLMAMTFCGWKNLQPILFK